MKKLDEMQTLRISGGGMETVADFGGKWEDFCKSLTILEIANGGYQFYYDFDYVSEWYTCNALDY